MAYDPEPLSSEVAEPTIVNTAVNYHDRVRWGPVLAGIAIALTGQLLLSALGAAIGLSAGATGANAGSVGLAVGIWSIVSLLISLFLGGWVMAQSCGPMTKKTAILNAAILWGTTLALSSWLLASGISGAAEAVAANAGEIADRVQQQGGVNIPNVDPNQVRDIAGNTAKATWSFLVGSLLSLAAAMIGAVVGARKPRVYI
ncbi:hypothetical protein IQ269_27175 [Tychonema sp. LEGE 07199]|uniref:hypothetical protein n=1 Tax=unclassified Tychonema TaxID=2642144 RepID=UPI0018806BAE|nr:MULTISPECIES: hypothetical protein [unclassified Tychonema]MBE9124374.1 hypothetical protein [Tychonema sp. LEGE 07199]MBE9132356.1 hypothetical protein [Tychonema sp. LEGE 07196]